METIDGFCRRMVHGLNAMIFVGNIKPTPPGIRITYHGGSDDLVGCTNSRGNAISCSLPTGFSNSVADANALSTNPVGCLIFSRPYIHVTTALLILSFRSGLHLVSVNDYPAGSLAMRFPATMPSADFSHTVEIDCSFPSQFASHVTLQGSRGDLPG